MILQEPHASMWFPQQHQWTNALPGRVKGQQLIVTVTVGAVRSSSVIWQPASVLVFRPAYRPTRLELALAAVADFCTIVDTPWFNNPASASGAQTIYLDLRHSPRAGHKPVCLVPAWDSPNACALLEFAEAPTHILRVSSSVDQGRRKWPLNG
ncbi:hypothetical protein ABBQ32_013654 [Trebouxia sp. C0010 RCD-2024]